MNLRRHLPAVVVLGLTLTSACTGPEPRALDDLAVVDSVYVEPGSGIPFTGPVFRDFADRPGEVEIAGTLREGTWDDELVVYHPNGRVRYQGSFRDGERCGPWTQNADSTETGSVYEALVREIETLAMYPPCEGEESG